MNNRVKIRNYLMDNIERGSFDNIFERYVAGAKRNHLVLQRESVSYLVVINSPNTYPGGLNRFKEFAREAYGMDYKMLQVFSTQDFPELSETQNADYFRVINGIRTHQRAEEVRRLKGVAKVCAQNGIPLNFLDLNIEQIEVYEFGKIASYATHRSVRGETIEIPEGRRETMLKDKMEPIWIQTLDGKLDLESDTNDRGIIIGKFKLWTPPVVEVPAPRIERGMSGRQLDLF